MLDFVEGPVEPREQELHVLAIDGGSAPEADAGGGVAVGAEVVAATFRVEQGDDLLGFGRLLFGGEAGVPLVDDLEADGCVGAGCRIVGEEVHPIGCGDPVGDGLVVVVGALDESGESADFLGPLEAVEGVLDAEHGDGVDGGSFEDSLDELAAFGHAEDLGHGPRGRVVFEAFDGAWAEGDHAVGGFAAHDLLPGPGDDVELLPR